MATQTVYRFRMFVGPVDVQHYADNARAAGFTNVIVGTEHVIGDVLTPTCRTETDRLVLCHRIAESVYGQPGHSTAWRDVRLF